MSQNLNMPLRIYGIGLEIAGLNGEKDARTTWSSSAVDYDGGCGSR